MVARPSADGAWHARPTEQGEDVAAVEAEEAAKAAAEEEKAKKEEEEAERRRLKAEKKANMTPEERAAIRIHVAC